MLKDRAMTAPQTRDLATRSLKVRAIGVVVIASFIVGLGCSSTQSQSQSEAIAVSTLDALRTQFKFPERASTDGTAMLLPARSVIPDAATYVSSDGAGHFAPHGAIDAAVVFPSSANGRSTIGTGTMRIDVALQSAKAVTASVAGGNVVYTGGDVHGGHIVETVLRDGFESFVLFNTSPNGNIVFDVNLTNVPGLRLVSNVLEFVDGGGAPRLRMSAPVVVDSVGNSLEATVAVQGCAYDTSPAGPWGRQVTAPGASSCSIHISWSDAGLTYPVLLDPSWTTTGSMTMARRWHGAILIPTMKVLVVGGEGVSSPYLSTSELYDPSSGTWASSGRLDPGRRRFTTTGITGGKVLIAGGETSSGRVASAQLYNPTTGTWTLTGSMTTTRAYHDAVYVDCTAQGS